MTAINLDHFYIGKIAHDDNSDEGYAVVAGTRSHSPEWYKTVTSGTDVIGSPVLGQDPLWAFSFSRAENVDLYVFSRFYYSPDMKWLALRKGRDHVIEHHILVPQTVLDSFRFNLSVLLSEQFLPAMDKIFTKYEVLEPISLTKTGAQEEKKQLTESITLLQRHDKLGKLARWILDNLLGSKYLAVENVELTFAERVELISSCFRLFPVGLLNSFTFASNTYLLSEKNVVKLRLIEQGLSIKVDGAVSIDYRYDDWNLKPTSALVPWSSYIINSVEKLGIYETLHLLRESTSSEDRDSMSDNLVFIEKSKYKMAELKIKANQADLETFVDYIKLAPEASVENHKFLEYYERIKNEVEIGNVVVMELFRDLFESAPEKILAKGLAVTDILEMVNSYEYVDAIEILINLNDQVPILKFNGIQWDVFEKWLLTGSGNGELNIQQMMGDADLQMGFRLNIFGRYWKDVHALGPNHLVETKGNGLRIREQTNTYIEHFIAFENDQSLLEISEARLLPEWKAISFLALERKKFGFLDAAWIVNLQQTIPLRERHEFWEEFVTLWNATQKTPNAASALGALLCYSSDPIKLLGHDVTDSNYFDKNALINGFLFAMEGEPERTKSKRIASLLSMIEIQQITSIKDWIKSTPEESELRILLIEEELLASSSFSELSKKKKLMDSLDNKDVGYNRVGELYINHALDLKLQEEDLDFDKLPGDMLDLIDKLQKSVGKQRRGKFYTALAQALENKVDNVSQLHQKVISIIPSGYKEYYLLGMSGETLAEMDMKNFPKLFANNKIKREKVAEIFELFLVNGAEPIEIALLISKTLFLCDKVSRNTLVNELVVFVNYTNVNYLEGIYRAIGVFGKPSEQEAFISGLYHKARETPELLPLLIELLNKQLSGNLNAFSIIADAPSDEILIDKEEREELKHQLTEILKKSNDLSRQVEKRFKEHGLLQRILRKPRKKSGKVK